MLTGGASVGDAYEHAARLEPDWSKVTLWWGDERCVPPDDERSNYRLAKETLLDRLEVPPRRCTASVASSTRSCRRRATTLCSTASSSQLLLLGLGGDSHMASLFAGSPQLDVVDRRATWGPPASSRSSTASR